MVVGIDKFREHFAGHEDKYVIIGGTACDLWYARAGLEFRITKDIDMVLCVETVDAAFGAAFKEFLDAGGYEARERSGGTKEFYRFRRPADENYPSEIELFAQRPEALKLPEDARLAPIPVDEAAASLSAILLDEPYYEALKNGKSVVDGVAIADTGLLIPFKARAFLNLSERREQGDDGIQRKKVRKHLKDVFRLAQLLRGDQKIEMREPIREDMRRFLNQVEADETLNPEAFDVPLTRDDGVARLRSAYGLD